MIAQRGSACDPALLPSSDRTTRESHLSCGSSTNSGTCSRTRGTPGGLLPALQTGQGFTSAGVVDPEEVFSDSNDRGIEIEVDVKRDGGETHDPAGVPYANRLLILFPRNTNAWTAQLFADRAPVVIEPSPRMSAPYVGPKGTNAANVSDLLEACRQLGNTMYIGPFRNALNLGAVENYFDIQAGQAFVTRWRSFQTGTNDFQKRMTNRITQDIRDIFGFSQLQILASEDASTLQLFINGNPYRLGVVGSGLTQFILTLANAATSPAEFVLIDEPELNLHPSLQVAFLAALGRYANTGVVFATHSIGLARTTAQSIYSFQKVAEGRSEVHLYEATPRLAELLGEMSFSAYRELGYEKLLLVEGPSEVKTIRQFLRWYGKDHSVVPLPLGGSSLINAHSSDELEEVKRLCDQVFALIDSECLDADATVAPDRQAFRDNCRALGIDCHVLERRATENYLADAAVKAVKGDKYRGL